LTSDGDVGANQTRFDQMSRGDDHGGRIAICWAFARKNPLMIGSRIVFKAITVKGGYAARFSETWYK